MVSMLIMTRSGRARVSALILAGGFAGGFGSACAMLSGLDDLEKVDCVSGQCEVDAGRIADAGALGSGGSALEARSAEGGAAGEDVTPMGDEVAPVDNDVTPMGEDAASPDDAAQDSSAADGGTEGVDAEGTDAVALADALPFDDVVVNDGPAADVSQPTDAQPTDAQPSDASDASSLVDAGADAKLADVVDAADACSSNAVDTSAGVFVARTGSDADSGSGCGRTPGAPCQTINAGIATARALGRTIVYVAAGVYTEQVALAAQVSVRGGWRFESGLWSFDCSAHPEAIVVIQAPANANRTILADNLAGTSVLSTVRVLSKPTPSSSESLYGVFASGSTTTVILDNVVVEVANAGDGQTGATGSTGAAPASSCSAGDGLAGSPAGGLGTGALAGTFSASGYAPTTGLQGGSGAPGHDGTAAPAPTPVSYTVCSFVLLCGESGANCTGSAGTHGCGGRAGGGGLGGTGGGSSIAVFVAGARVTLQGGSYTAGNGGRGARGGSGGTGTSGSAGTQGDSKTCTDARHCALGCANDPNVVGPGTTGGTGGTASNGGQGGGGSGGSSYAVIVGAAGLVTYLATPKLATGSAGTSLGNGASGMAATAATF